MIQIDMDMPKNCLECYIEHESIGYYCAATGYITNDVRLNERHSGCPLVEVPDNNVGSCSEIPKNSTDCTSRQAMFEAIEDVAYDVDAGVGSWYELMNDKVRTPPSIQSEIIMCEDCKQAAIDAITVRADRCAENFSTDDPFWEGLVIAKSIVEGIPSVGNMSKAFAKAHECCGGCTE